MIRYLVILILAMALATPAMAGGLWDMYKNSDLPTKASKAFQLEVKGVNTRGYIFHVPEMKSVCVITYGDETASQMECKTYDEMGMSAKERNELPK